MTEARCQNGGPAVNDCDAVEYASCPPHCLQVRVFARGASSVVGVHSVMRWRLQIKRFGELAQRHYAALIALGRLGIPSDIVGLIEMEILRNTMPFIRTIHSLLRCIGSDRKPAERSWEELCAQRNAMIRMFGTLVHHRRFFYRLLLNMPLMVPPLDVQ